MFERFTEKAIKTIMLSQEEARRLGHIFVSPEFLFLGLVLEGTGIAAKSLKTFGLQVATARAAVEAQLGRGTGSLALEMPFTGPAKAVLEAAWHAAREWNHNYIGTEHLLIGLMETKDTVLDRALDELELDREKIIADVRARITRFPQQAPGIEISLPPERKSRPNLMPVRIPCRECGETISSQAARCLFCNAGFDELFFKNCPYCAESIRKAAVKCRWCQSDLSS